MKQNDSSIKFGCIIGLLIMILLAIGLLFFFLLRADVFPLDINPTSIQTSKTDTNSEPKNFDQDNNRNVDEYIEITFLPFEFKFSVPSDWVVETTEIGGDPPSQKCLTHHISSPGGFARLEVVPMCGAYGGAPESCPETTEIIGNISDDLLGRYPASSGDPVLPKLTYTNVNDNYCIGLVINSTRALKVTANYNGPDSEWPRYLSELDKIVLSLAK